MDRVNYSPLLVSYDTDQVKCGPSLVVINQRLVSRVNSKCCQFRESDW